MSKQQHIYGPAFKSKLDLMGVRFVTDPGDGAGAGDGDAAAQAAAAAAAAGSGAPAGVGADQGDSNAPWTKENFDPERAWRLTENLRSDLAEQKTKTDKAIADAVAQAQKDIVAQIGKGLGFGATVVETDPAKLNQSITELTSRVGEKDQTLAANARTIAVLSNPAIRNANTHLLLANTAFTDSIASVEPTDEAAITAAINKALQANAALKATPSRSGSGEHQGATVQSLEAALAAAQQKGDKTETIRLKMAIAAARRRAKA